MISYQWTSAVVAITIAATIVVLVRRNHLPARNGIWWIALALIIAVLGSLPRTVNAVAAILGIHYPPVLVLMIGMGVLLLKLLRTDIERSRGQQEVRILGQKVAVLEARMRSLEETGSGARNEPVGNAKQ